MEKLRKKGLAVFKLLFSILLLYLVFTRIPFTEVWEVIRQAQLSYLLMALLAFAGSKWIAARRLNLYFHKIKIHLDERSNRKLYLLGMFYNLFLPGGIGGDAYKGYLLHRTFGTPGKSLAQVLLLDRLSGLALLAIYCIILLPWVSHPRLETYQALVWAGIPIGILLYRWAHQRAFPLLHSIFWISLGYSALVQFAQLVSVYLILMALGVTGSVVEYLLIFMISSIVAILPLTIGGIGSREVVFYYGAKWLGLQEDISIGVSLTFFALTALVSLLGIVYHFRNPKLNPGSDSLNPK